MIFVTVGTHQDGFPRLLQAVEDLPTSDIVVQYGNGSPPANARDAEPFMSFARMLSFFDEADHVIMHAGVGSILLAIRHGHVPIIVPRLHRLGEHVDDHQSDLAQGLEASGKVRVVWDSDQLATALAAAPARTAAVSLPRTGLHTAVRAALLDGDAST